MSFFYGEKEDRSFSFSKIFGLDSNSYEAVDSEKEATYYTCLNYISNAIAKLPLEVLDIQDGFKTVNAQGELVDKLSIRPNPYMSPFVVMKTFIQNGLNDGVSALYINPDGNLFPVRITEMFMDDVNNINMSDMRILYSCRYGNCSFDSLENNLILFKYGFSRYGTKTEALQHSLDKSIQTLSLGQNTLKDTLSSHGLGKIAIQTASSIEDKAVLKALQKKLGELYSQGDKIFTLPAGYQLQSLNATLSDQDFEAIRKLSKKEICSSFNLPSTIIGETEGLNYSSLEQLQLQIYTECLQPIMTQIEQEINYKLRNRLEDNQRIEFNEDMLYRLDMDTRINNLKQLMHGSILTANDVRKDLGYEHLDSKYSDSIILTSGFLPVELAEEYYSKDTKGGGDDSDGNQAK